MPALLHSLTEESRTRTRAVPLASTPDPRTCATSVPMTTASPFPHTHSPPPRSPRNLDSSILSFPLPHTMTPQTAPPPPTIHPRIVRTPEFTVTVWSAARPLSPPPLSLCPPSPRTPSPPLLPSAPKCISPHINPVGDERTCVCVCVCVRVCVCVCVSTSTSHSLCL